MTLLYSYSLNRLTICYTQQYLWTKTCLSTKPTNSGMYYVPFHPVSVFLQQLASSCDFVHIDSADGPGYALWA